MDEEMPAGSTDGPAEQDQPEAREDLPPVIMTGGLSAAPPGVRLE